MPGRPRSVSAVALLIYNAAAFTSTRSVSRSHASSPVSSGRSPARLRCQRALETKFGVLGDALRITIGRTLKTSISRPFGQPALLDRGSFRDGLSHSGNQPTDISLIHRRCTQTCGHRPIPRKDEITPVDANGHIRAEVDRRLSLPGSKQRPMAMPCRRGTGFAPKIRFCCRVSAWRRQ
jgi:hypothetical protein